MPMSAGRARPRAISGEGMAPIVHHPDVQRNLLTMQALTARCPRDQLCLRPCHRHGACRARATRQRHWQERANLLTPIAKAFSTDVGVEVASLGVQVHGGMGFIEETGAASLYRDARIAPIYEGTNGIQAIDLVTRKLPQSGGEHVLGYIAELGESASRRSAPPTCTGFGRTAEATRQGGRRPARSDALPAGRCWPTAGRDRRWPAPRPISGCSRWRPAAPISRKAALADESRRSGSRSAASLPKICSARPRR